MNLRPLLLTLPVLLLAPVFSQATVTSNTNNPDGGSSGSSGPDLVRHILHDLGLPADPPHVARARDPTYDDAA